MGGLFISMNIKNRFNIEDIVYLKTDADQQQRIIAGIIVRPNGILVYEICCGTENSNHYEFEISKEEDKVLKTK
jgi:hypothetical protein